MVVFCYNLMIDNIFGELKDKILSYDPVYFAEKYLTVDGSGDPFLVSQKGWKPFADIYRYVGLKSIEKNGKPMIIVASRQVGKTTMAAVVECYFLASGLYGENGKIPMRIMHLFPTIGHATAYSKTKFGPMINGSKTIEKEEIKKGKKYINHIPFMSTKLDNSVEQSITFKKFGSNTIEIQSTGMNGDRIRGRTADVIFFDEVQDMRADAIGNASKILNQSKFGTPGEGVQIYFGTAKRKGSTFHKMWQNSNQQYYHLGCEGCDSFFPLYTPESNSWEEVWIHSYTVKCTHCGHEQDKREAAGRGKWIPAKPDDECQFVGYHINQLYMPTFAKETILKQKPNVHATNTERIYQNEVLGEFYQGDASLIDADEIYEKCGDMERSMRPVIHPGEEHMVVMGIDFGGKADAEQLANPEASKGYGKSYSTIVILSVKGAGLFNIELAIKMKKNDPEYKRSLIQQLIRQYSVDLVVGDIGFSNDLSQMLYKENGDKYLVSRALSKISAMGRARFNKDLDVPEIQFERNYYIGEFIEKLKKGNVRFPLKDYEKIAWLIEHCSSMEIKANIPNTGEPNISYIKGSTPNDGFMAMLNGYLAYKFLVTKGFSESSLFENKNIEKKQKPLIIGGYINKLL